MKSLIVFLFLITGVFAQTTLTGYVYNSVTDEPLNLANVIIQNSTTGTTTNAEGEFTLSGNFGAQDILVISYLGFETKEMLNLFNIL